MWYLIVSIPDLCTLTYFVILLYYLVYMYVFVFLSFDFNISYVNVVLPGHVQLFLLLIAFGFIPSML